MALAGRNLVAFGGGLIFLFLQVASIQGHAGHDHDHHGHGHAHAGHHHHDHSHDAHDHHDHEHNDEPPSFKYSKQANQAPAAPPAQVKPSHGHQHAAHSHSGHQHGAHSHGGHQHGTGKHVHSAPTKAKVSATSPAIQHPWFYALLSTLLISLAPFFILFWIPIDANDEKNQPLLRIFLSFASGGLLGDAFLHLIPHAVPHSHGHGHDHGHSHHGHDHAEGEEHEEVHDHMGHTIVGLWVLAGIISFLIVEKVIRHLKGGHDHGHSHGHSHEHTPAVKDGKSRGEKSEGEETVEERAVTRKLSHDESELATKNGEDDLTDEAATSARAISEERSAEQDIATAAKTGEIRVSGYLNLAADFAHNFTDGLAIGASFLAGQGIGWITTLTILFHEIPHEIGDFALLIQSGCSKPKAIALQLVTAVGAFSGCLVSLAFGSTATEGSSSPVLAFTAGGFIYIATVSVIPELLSDVKIGQSIKEILALLIGIGVMVIIAVYE